MALAYDPYNVFKSSKTPAGLYARQKWLGESNDRQWNNDFDETVDKLFEDQAHDGSWQQSELKTINRLFGLHLTVREASGRIDAALDWLMNKIDLPPAGYQPGSETDANFDSLQSLPFIKSRSDLFQIGATLFLSSIFGRHNDPSILSIYHWLSTEGLRNKGLWFDRACTHNILRAMVVHPVYGGDPATVMAVESLADLQLASGEWGDGLPFYQTVNALAHIDIPAADKQLKQAFPRLYESQNEDGSWGETEAEWNTFLVIHAMRNKGLI